MTPSLATDLPFSLSSSYVGHWSLGRTVFCTEHWTALWIRKALSSMRCWTGQMLKGIWKAIIVWYTHPGASLQGLLDVLILVQTVVVIQSKLVKSRGAEINDAMMQTPYSVFLIFFQCLLKGPSLESDIVSEVSPESCGGVGSGSCGQAASCAGKKWHFGFLQSSLLSANIILRQASVSAGER